MIFTSVIIWIVITLDLHHNQDDPNFSSLELFPPPFYNYFLLLFISYSVFLSPTSSFLHFLMWLHPFRSPLPNYLFCILWHPSLIIPKRFSLVSPNKQNLIIQHIPISISQYFSALVLPKITWKGPKWSFSLIRLAILFSRETNLH